ncbi:ATP-binding cassette domain-containing protein, partial [Spirillospora sp. NPDC048819]|uniref:ABC transporter ATP-binding protein n=1 Tax=Spirillospora sp. NPDC048819 TaxID=3155268 RepID=UPI0034084692
MLRVDRLSAWYGEAQALREVSMRVDEGEIVTLVGRNGAGKTTLLRCLMGLHGSYGRTAGTVSLSGEDVTGLAPHRRARRGLGFVPDDRGVFATLSVEENLTLPPAMGSDPWPLERVYETFPKLRERRRFPGTKLSGGEQQMLALARVLRTGARLLLCDEPTEGLS